MEIKAKKDFEMNGKFYEIGDMVDVPSKEMLIKLNEKGLIEPVTPKQIQNWKKSQNIIIPERKEKKEDELS